MTQIVTLHTPTQSSSGFKFHSVHEILECNHSSEAMEKLFPVERFVVLYKVVLIFFCDKIHTIDHSNESY